MDWNIVQLPVENIYDKLDISFTPFFKENIQLFKEIGYERILDIGCGYGKHSIYLAENNFNVTSIDINAQAIEWLKRYIDRKSISNITLIQADMNSLPFQDNYFDTVICTSVLHHQDFKQIENSISEIYRVLRRRGYFLFDFLSVEDDSFGIGEEIEKNTFVGSREGEENIPHHYTDVIELNELFNNFRKIKIQKNEYHIIIDSERKIKSRVFDVLTYK
ncbi:class I SAM-dependent methyltransferase [Acidilutibacter cellobiosedens]|mgnify:FL=1|jgi:ubiquinone/menaquinone biosynthesis C-methylase UbiE|uniref:Class I SAM-dependent methyltransferase n=2 Tax=Tissierellales TaxID=1737405 RepID=A0A926ESB3_9FIRM|nr:MULTISPECIES: class I SAM-dependent methyltransferase [Tissierellales]MBC8587318.1 class I SAM-dependent methyltransferase [Paratissierella segnis]QAT60338.1 class I SAM-dependent methyltransferase [Acidilutibacter cellobiosedens]